MAVTGLVLDDCFKQHNTGPGHPERSERLTAIQEALGQAGLIDRCRRIEPESVSLDLALTNHTREYINRLEKLCHTGKGHIDCNDSTISLETFDTTRLAAGSVAKAVDMVARGEINNAFCAVRPPGHHAERAFSMGFCMWNNVAIAAHHLIREHGIERILILDWDVHHGNGTQHAFEADPRVFFCSIHGHPDTLYPGTGYSHERGLDEGEGLTLNLPMMPGANDEDYRRVYHEQFLPAAREYKPEFILMSAGFDPHRLDPIAHIDLETSSFGWLTSEPLALADEFCNGRLVSVIEGGYNLQALGESTTLHVEELLKA